MLRSHKNLTIGYKLKEILKEITDYNFALTPAYLYSWVGLVLPYTEELISPPFVGENRFRLVFQDRMGPKNAIGCVVVSAHLLFVLTSRSWPCSRQDKAYFQEDLFQNGPYGFLIRAILHFFCIHFGCFGTNPFESIP